MFTMRTSKPQAENKHYIRQATGGWNSCIQGKPTDSQCNVLSNCVGYANGRFNEIISELTGYQGNKYNTLNCNAENFIERAKAAGLEIGQTPKAGAIICWQKGNTLSGNDGAGHVAIVEKVIDSNTIYTSESGYNCSAFWNSTRTNLNGRWGIGSAYKFRGFIYNPAVKDEPIPTGRYTYKQFVGDVQSAIGAKVDFIAGPETLSKTPTVSAKINRNHKVVTALERYLKLLGYYNGEIEADNGKTPIFGSGMTAALKQFQKANGCVSDGEATSRCMTWKKLLKLA